jgi:hypothetical protein
MIDLTDPGYYSYRVIPAPFGDNPAYKLEITFMGEASASYMNNVFWIAGHSETVACGLLDIAHRLHSRPEEQKSLMTFQVWSARPFVDDLWWLERPHRPMLRLDTYRFWHGGTTYALAMTIFRIAHEIRVNNALKQALRTRSVA